MATHESSPVSWVMAFNAALRERENVNEMMVAVSNARSHIRSYIIIIIIICTAKGLHASPNRGLVRICCEHVGRIIYALRFVDGDISVRHALLYPELCCIYVSGCAQHRSARD